uniref:Vesicle transport protein n=1 Tax=Nothobranchius furzeri TaxID=105023 RepID=A0A8C6P5N0_NOTFU
MDKLKSVLSGEEARREDRNVLQTVSEASSLSWSTRIKGFIACFVVGAACTVLGVCVLFLPKIGLTLFIVFYTFGNICALCSTMFLMGPVKQLKRMCDKTRALATTIMLVRPHACMCTVVLGHPISGFSGSNENMDDSLVFAFKHSLLCNFLNKHVKYVTLKFLHHIFVNTTGSCVRS